MEPSFSEASMNGVSIERVSPVQITYARFWSTSHNPKSSNSETIGSCPSTRRTSMRSIAKPIRKKSGTMASGASNGSTWKDDHIHQVM